jgi:hypothetical protein
MEGLRSGQSLPVSDAKTTSVESRSRGVLRAGAMPVLWSIKTLLEDSRERFLVETEPHPDLRLGQALPAIPAGPREFTLATAAEAAGELSVSAPVSANVEPLEYYASECLWSRRLLEATEAAGGDNLQAWPVRLVHPATGRSWEYRAVNVVGLIRSEELSPLQVARDDSSLTLLLAEPVKRAWESLKLADVSFVKQLPRS